MAKQNKLTPDVETQEPAVARSFDARKWKYQAEKNILGAYHPSVPLADLTAEEFAALSNAAKAFVEDSGFYVAE